MDKEYNVTLSELQEVTRRSAQTIRTWIKQGLSRNEDGTFSLPAFFRWYEDYLKLSIRSRIDPNTSKLNKIKAETKKFELQKMKKEFLPRNEVVCGIIGRYQRLISNYYKIPILITSLAGKSYEERTKIMEDWFDDLLAGQREQFDEIKLLPKAEKLLLELLDLLDKELK